MRLQQSAAQQVWSGRTDLAYSACVLYLDGSGTISTTKGVYLEGESCSSVTFLGNRLLGFCSCFWGLTCWFNSVSVSSSIRQGHKYGFIPQAGCEAPFMKHLEGTDRSYSNGIQRVQEHNIFTPEFTPLYNYSAVRNIHRISSFKQSALKQALVKQLATKQQGRQLAQSQWLPQSEISNGNVTYTETSFLPNKFTSSFFKGTFKVENSSGVNTCCVSTPASLWSKVRILQSAHAMRPHPKKCKILLLLSLQGLTIWSAFRNTTCVFLQRGLAHTSSHQCPSLNNNTNNDTNNKNNINSHICYVFKLPIVLPRQRGIEHTSPTTLFQMI